MFVKAAAPLLLAIALIGAGAAPAAADDLPRVPSWSVPPAWCTGIGFTMSIQNTARPSDPSGRMEITATSTQSAAYVASAYGVTVVPAYEVFTARGGLRRYDLSATTGYGYGEQAVNTCAVPFPAVY